MLSSQAARIPLNNVHFGFQVHEEGGDAEQETKSDVSFTSSDWIRAWASLLNKSKNWTFSIEFILHAINIAASSSQQESKQCMHPSSLIWNFEKIHSDNHIKKYKIMHGWMSFCVGADVIHSIFQYPNYNSYTKLTQRGEMTLLENRIMGAMRCSCIYQIGPFQFFLEQLDCPILISDATHIQSGSTKTFWKANLQDDNLQ